MIIMCMDKQKSTSYTWNTLLISGWSIIRCFSPGPPQRGGPGLGIITQFFIGVNFNECLALYSFLPNLQSLLPEGIGLLSKSNFSYFLVIPHDEH